MKGNDTKPPEAERLSHRLYAEFEITPAASLSCPLASFETNVTDVKQQLCGNKCHVEATPIDESTAGKPTVIHRTGPRDPDCHCLVFLEYDCIPRITEITDRTMRLETYLPERERLTGLIDDLKAVTDGLSLRRLIRIDADDSPGQKTVTLNLHRVTEKQREAAINAVAAGYYESPRKATVGELAAELEISKSALSQRLTAVESKLATAAFKRAP